MALYSVFNLIGFNVTKDINFDTEQKLESDIRKENRKMKIISVFVTRSKKD